MADKEISALTAGTALGGTEVFHGSQGGNSRKFTANQLRAVFRGALVKKSVDQTAANYTTSTMVAWDAEAYDTDTIHDTVTNNSRLSVPSGVTKVRLEGQISLASVTNDVVYLVKTFKNGSGTYDGYAQDIRDVVNSAPMINVRSPVLEVVGGTDYFELQLTVLTDTSITVSANGSWFAMEIVA